MATTRNQGIDTMRGIGLLVVIIAHGGFELQMQNRGFFVFAMPLFYLAAGIFFKNPKSMRQLVIDKYRRLIVPFIVFWISGIVIYAVGNTLQSDKPFVFSLFNLLSTDRFYVPYPASLWFFLSIFWCYILYGAARRCTENDLTLGMICLATGICGWILSRHLALPLSLDTSLSWMPFFFIGNMIGTHKSGELILSGKHWPIGITAIIVCCTINSNNGYVAGYCYNLFVGCIPAIILLNLGATAGLATVCCRIKHIPVITRLGRNSIVIFAVHQHYMIIFQQLARYLGIDNGNTAVCIIIIALSIAASAATSIIINRYAPWIIGRKRATAITGPIAA